MHACCTNHCKKSSVHQVLERLPRKGECQCHRKIPGAGKTQLGVVNEAEPEGVLAVSP